MHGEVDNSTPFLPIYTVHRAAECYRRSCTRTVFCYGQPPDSKRYVVISRSCAATASNIHRTGCATGTHCQRVSKSSIRFFLIRPCSRYLRQIPATEEGILAAQTLEREGILTSLYLVTSLVHAQACVEAGVSAISVSARPVSRHKSLESVHLKLIIVYLN